MGLHWWETWTALMLSTKDSPLGVNGLIKMLMFRKPESSSKAFLPLTTCKFITLIYAYIMLKTAALIGTISCLLFWVINRGREWNEPRKTCNGQMQPLTGSTYPGGSLPAASIVSRVLSTMRTPVYLLDITTLSQLRKDAHPSTYGGDGGTDCSHWCLPGLPDTWNQLLYAALSMWKLDSIHTCMYITFLAVQRGKKEEETTDILLGENLKIRKSIWR